MPIHISEKERRLPFDTYYVEGTESGLTDDLKFRPNKYFHPIDSIDANDRECVFRYQRSLAPVEGELTLEQVRQILLGVLDAQQRVAHDQTFYLFPGVEAFGLDRQHNLRIALINARPIRDRECDPQEMNVDAFIRLLAAHCPEAHKRIVAYNKPILTLRHLQQILEYKGAPILTTAFATLAVVGLIVFGLLHQYGPPRIRQPLQQWTSGVLQSGKRFTRSGTDEWYVQIGEERRKREYTHPPLSLTLVLQPQVNTDEERQTLFQFLNRLLATEFPNTRYQLLLPSPDLSSKAYMRWKAACEYGFQKQKCLPKSWLLQIDEYKGAIRPLLGALREAMHQERANKPLVELRYVELIGMADLTLKKNTPPATPQTTPPSPAPTKDSDPTKAPAPATQNRTAPPTR